MFKPGSSSEIVFANDGGVYYTSNGTATLPAITSRVKDYNVVQLYRCAIHPTLTDFFLGGSQDNGTMSFTSPGINNVNTVIDGDGFNCDIDKDNPNYQVGSVAEQSGGTYYYRSIDGGISFFQIPLAIGGLAFNPSDYDDANNILYLDYFPNILKRVTNFTSAPVVGQITINNTNFPGVIRVSPYTPSTLFLGGSDLNGNPLIFKTTNAQTSNPLVSVILNPSWPPFISISDIEIGANEDQILVTFSNYGVVSVWETKDGGITWLNKEGDLPDMPVWDALYNPNDRKEVMLATELGVWSCDDISTSSPMWQATNSGLANVRVSQLATRPSDNLVIAATYGRGLFSTRAFNHPVAKFNFASSSPCFAVGIPVNFTDQSSNIPTSWSWNFGDSFSSTAQNPNHTYAFPGTYVVTLTATNNDGSGSTIQQLIVINSIGVIDYPTGLNITSNTVFNNVTKTFTGPLIISPGATLTLNNCTFEFAEKDAFGNPVFVVVSENAKLILNGSTFKGLASCGNMWTGVEVWGNSSLIQYNPITYTGFNQGFIWLNNSTIRDSRRGILIGDVDANGNPLLFRSGGIIWAENNTQFINNRVSVKFNEYPYLTNKSRFSKCQFTCDNSFIDQVLYNGTGNDVFVEMLGVFHITFRGCSFQNTGTYTTLKRGYGIRSVDSKFILDNTCEIISTPCNDCAGTKNTFNQLDYGVYAIASDPFNSIYIKGCDFIKNYRGVILRGVDYSTIIKNKFDVGEGTSGGYGLYLDMCTGYQVEENQFFSSFTINNFGSILNISGNYANTIYNNRFNNINVGISVQGDNAGLKIKCNSFTTPFYQANIALVGNAIIANPQGICSANTETPAGNTFSHDCSNLDNDIFSNSGSTGFTYNYHNDLLRKPQCHDAIVTVPIVGCATAFSSASCPTHLCNQSNNTQLKNLISNYSTKVASDKQLIDGGNTQGLLNLINSNASEGIVKNSLAAASPYLSDTILSAYLKRVLTPTLGHIKDIIVANSPVSPQIMAIVNSMILPSGIRNQINQNQTGVSARTQLELEISYFEGERQLFVNELIRFYLNDTTITTGIDSVIAVLKLENTTSDKCLLSGALVKTNQLAEANSLIDSLHANSPMDNYCALQKILIQLKQANQTCYQMTADTLLKGQVTILAKDTSHFGCPNAQALLELVFGTRFAEHIEPLQSPANIRISDYSSTEYPKDSTNIFCYPNPANESVTFVYNLPSDGTFPEAGVITLYNMLGDKISTFYVPRGNKEFTVNVTDLNVGVYFYTLSSNNIVVAKNKMIVIR